jgi:uncharacterized protein (UPF0333 family)
MKFNKKGQGALEYLLLIGGAVLIAVIVIALLVGMGSSGRQSTQENATTTTEIVSGTAIAPILNSASCIESSDYLLVNYVSQGGTLSIITDGATDANQSAIVSGGTGIDMTTACSAVGTNYSVQIRATTTSGSSADSNPILVTGR